MTRYRYRYDAAAARSLGVRLPPEEDIALLAPDVTDLEAVPLAECWLFAADAMPQLPPYVEMIGGLSTKEQAAASAAGLQVCPKCGEWLPRDWTDFECHGPGRHDVSAVVPPLHPIHPTRTDVEREFKQATVGAFAVAILIVLVLAVLGTIAWLER